MTLTREGALPLDSISRKSDEILSPTNSSLRPWFLTLAASLLSVCAAAGSVSTFENSAARLTFGAMFCSKAASVEAPTHWTRLCSRASRKKDEAAPSNALDGPNKDWRGSTIKIDLELV